MGEKHQSLAITERIIEEKTAELTMSVIVPAHNAERTLDKCLQAILSSTHEPLEIIVVDDASTDKTRQIAAQFGVRLVRLGDKLGQGMAKNAATEIAGGDIFVFVDADIVIAKDSLGIISEHFQNNSNTAALTGCLAGDAPVKGFFSRYKNRYMEFVFSRLPHHVDFLFTSIAAIRRPLFLPFVQSRIKADDTELGLRISENGADIIFCPELRVQHLKEYSFASFIRNEFRIPFDWAQIFLNRKGLNKLMKKGRFAHARFSQIVGLFFASTTAILFIASIAGYATLLLPLAGMITTLGLHHRFLMHIAKQEGIMFGIAGSAVTVFDPMIMTTGIVAGFAAYSIRSIRKFGRRIFANASLGTSGE